MVGVKMLLMHLAKGEHLRLMSLVETGVTRA